MNKKEIFSLAILFASASIFYSCSDDEEYDVDGSSDNIVFLSPQTPDLYESQIMRTEAGIFGYVGADVGINLQRSTSGNVQVTLAPDESLVAEYNTEHETEYSSLPEEIANAITFEEASFDGQTLSDTVKISLSDSYYEKLTEPSYLVPLRISIEGSSDKSVRPSTNRGVAYLLINTSDESDFVVLDKKTVSCSLIKTPVGEFGGIDATINVSLKSPIASEWISTAVVDNSLIQQYNTDNGTSYEALPENALNSLSITPETISAGNSKSDEGIKISSNIDDVKSLTGSYLVPLRITSSYKGKEIVEDSDIVYITLNIKNSLINDDATEFLGTKATEHDGWTVLDCENLDPANYEGLFDTSWGGGWSFKEKGSSAKFTLDLGAEKSLCGFYLSCYAMNDCNVEISSDNSNWIEVGNTSEHKAISEYNYETWEYKQEYVFYAAVKCRYIRYTFTLDESSWAWNYEGYANINAFALYFNN